jgi:transposase
MVRQLGQQLRDLIILKHNQNLPAREIALFLEVTTKTVRRIIQGFMATGSSAPKRRPGNSRIYTNEHVDYITKLIRAKRSISIDTLKFMLNDAHNITVSSSTMNLILKRAGYTKKQLSRRAIESDQAAGVVYMDRMRERYNTQQLVSSL